MRRLELFCLAGLLVVVLGVSISPVKSWANYGDFVTTFPNQTSVGGALLQPTKVAVDPANGNVYVTDDEGNVNRVKEYDKGGNFLSSFIVNGTPVGIAVDANNIFVGDSTNKCVWIYNKSGALTDLTGTGTSHKLGGANGAAISMPNDVAIAPSGHIFVVDGDNDRVDVYDSTGALTATFGSSGSGTSSGTSLYFYYPVSITFGASSVSGTNVTQYFYVGDQGNYRVQELYYVYDNQNMAITTPPTFWLTLGGEGDAFGSFLRVSDTVFDSTNPGSPTLVVLDDLQMVGQQFDSNGNSKSAAFNYSGSATEPYLSTPTGAAVDTANQRLYVANNQSRDISVFSTQPNVALPTIAITAPSVATTPCTQYYTVSFNGTASSDATVKLYYFNELTPSNKTLFYVNTYSTTSTYSGSALLNLVGTFPNWMVAGTYGIYAEVTDTTNDFASTTATGTIGITTVSGNYTCSMQAAWGPGTEDTDGDGISDMDEINGTYNTAYGNAPTNPLDKDTDHDGLDDGVEEGVVPLNSNKTVPISYTGPLVNAGGYLINHTNPNNPDTDGGGTSDAVEIIKGTDPTSGADDLVVSKSPQDEAAAYVIGDSQLMDSVITLQNPTNYNIVVDLDFYNLNGTLIKTVPGIMVAPFQLVTKDTYTDCGVSGEASVEVRATSSAIRADLTRTRKYYAEPQTYDDGAGMEFSLSSDVGTPISGQYTQYLDEYLDASNPNYRFMGTVYVKNWSDSSANVTLNFSDGENTSNPIVTKTYVLAAHETMAVRPSSVVTYNQGGLIATSDQPITISFYVERWNANDTLSYDTSYGENATPTLSNYYYSPTWVDTTNNYSTDSTHNYGWLPASNDYNYRFIDWYYMHNFSNTTSVNVTATFYDMNGNVVLTKTYTLPPNGQQNIRPLIEGATNIWTYNGTTYVPNTTTPIVAQGSAEFSGTGPFGIIDWVQRLNTAVYNYNSADNEYQYVGPATADYAYLVPMVTAPRNTQYVSSYYDWERFTYPNDFLDTVFAYNPNSVTANLTVSYYNPDGTAVTGGVISKSIPAHATIAWRPYATDNMPHTGSIAITSDQPFVGFSYYQRWNYNDYNTFDYAIGRPMQ